ncbi:hypothetical protein [Escherichia coli]|uniref:hypothetical protein n=1 Tax=Escherichia coli TaxID=562 RepID=UPI002F9688B7
MKTLKQAAMQFLANVRQNRCTKLSYRDAIDGLSIDDKNEITRCTHKDSRATIAALRHLISEIESIESHEYIVILHNGNGYDVRTVFKSEEEALMQFRRYVMNNKKVSLTIG